jgi:uncharacterized protein
MEVQVACLLHQVDDSKYFLTHMMNYENAHAILSAIRMIDTESCTQILKMIDLVSCSKNGNNVPDSIVQSRDYHLLIPRWADRLEAVGPIGVVRCYQYSMEHSRPLSSETSPRATSPAEVWNYATPERFDAYIQASSSSSDMISHYYDKLLHIACPPPEFVRNSYLEEQARESSKELVGMCIRFGRTGTVDIDFVKAIAEKLNIHLKQYFRLVRATVFLEEAF